MMTDPSIADQLLEAAVACEKAAAEMLEKARRHRAAIAALEAKPPPGPFPALVCQRHKAPICFCEACQAQTMVRVVPQGPPVSPALPWYPFPWEVSPPVAPFPSIPTYPHPFPLGPMWVGDHYPFGGAQQPTVIMDGTSTTHLFHNIVYAPSGGVMPGTTVTVGGGGHPNYGGS